MNTKRQFVCGLTSACLFLIISCSEPNSEDIPLGNFSYDSSQIRHCEQGVFLGKAGRSNREQLAGGHRYSVRTPANYDSRYQHPLIVVFSAARHHRFRTEAKSKLTTAATQAGFIIAYVDSVHLSLGNIRRLSQVPLDIASKWCVDQSRIYLSGHSDGGTVSNAIAFLPGLSFRPKAIAPSAAGIQAIDMQGESCPSAVAVMTWQNNNDQLFPGYGGDLARWWAECHQCTLETESFTSQCQAFKGCTNDVEIAICTSPGRHQDWPNASHDIVEFFLRN